MQESATKKKRKNFLVPLTILFLVLLAAAGYYVQHINQFLDAIHEPDDFEEPVVPKEKDPEYTRTNILLLGVDALTPKEKGRTDTIMFLSLDDKTREASLLSIPRSRVNIPGRKMDKINHAYVFGGIPLTISAWRNFWICPFTTMPVLILMDLCILLMLLMV